MNSDSWNVVRDIVVVGATLTALAAFTQVSLPGLFAFVAQLVAAVACSAFVLRVMDVL